MDEERAPAAPAGWFATEGGRERYWDGTRWTDAFRDAESMSAEVPAAGSAVAEGQPYEKSPAGFIGGGVILCFVGVVFSSSEGTSLTGADGLIGLLAFLAGAALVLVGIIAYGNRFGRRN